jgi:hypothetical protein
MPRRARDAARDAGRCRRRSLELWAPSALVFERGLEIELPIPEKETEDLR